MHKLKPTSVLTSSLHVAPPSWEEALRFLQRSLIETGSALDIEHSQRLGLLLSKNVGRASEAHKWASLFNAEDVATCSMMLKALVWHGSWKSAMQLFEWSSDAPSFVELGEHLAQFMIAKGLVKESVVITTHLLRLTAGEKPERGALSNCPAYTASNAPIVRKDHTDLSRAMNDIVGLAENPAYVPREEQTCYSGLGSVVFRKFPRNSQWKEAVEMLQRLGQRACGETKLRLSEYEFARRVHGGKDHVAVHCQLRENPLVASSLPLQRSLFHSSLAVGDLHSALASLGALVRGGANQIPSYAFDEFCCRFTRDADLGAISANDERRFALLVVGNHHDVRNVDTRIAIATFLSRHSLDVGALENTAALLQARLHESLPMADAHSIGNITSLDRAAARLLEEGHWKVALRFVERIGKLEPTTPEERIIRETVLKNGAEWEKVLRFFS